jgi:hypothetical protein
LKTYNMFKQCLHYELILVNRLKSTGKSRVTVKRIKRVIISS